jgi:hypothetical protein
MFSDFFRLIKSFFSESQTNSAKNLVISTKIVDKLMSVKNVATGAVEGLVKTDEKVVALSQKLAIAEQNISILGDVKGDAEIVPYAYDEDVTEGKPTEGVLASVFFAYVMAFTGNVVTPGRKFSIQLSGDQSIPMVVNGKLQSGNSGESLFTTVHADGTQTYVFQSNKTDEKFGALAEEADLGAKAMKANTDSLNLLETRLDAI